MPFKIKLGKSETSKPAIQQVFEMVNWGSRLLATPTDYINYRLYERGVGSKEAIHFLSAVRAVELREIFNKEIELLEDKIKYESHFSRLDLPLPQSLAVITHGEADTTHTVLQDKSAVIHFISKHILDGDQLVIKEVSGMQGAGVIVIVGITEIDGQDFFILSTGENRSAQEVIGHILEKNGRWLIQKRLKQHELLNAFNSTSVNTLRLGTFRNQDGTVEIDYAVLRLGRSFNQIDAFNHGGVAVRINTETGDFSQEGWQKAAYSKEPIQEHPDSKIPFAGCQIPFWDEVVDLAYKFAVNAGNNKMIGWDVVITDDGPVFLEGNHNADVRLAQIGNVGMLTNSFYSRLKRETDLKWSNSELPPVALSRLFSLIKSR